MVQNDAASFEAEGGPGTLVVEGGAVDEKDGTSRTVQFLLHEDGAEAIAIGVTVQAERAGGVGDVRVVTATMTITCHVGLST